MGQLIDVLTGKRVYFDTNIIIYLIEGSEAYSGVLSELEDLLATGTLTAVTSEFTLCEALIAPIKRQSKEGIEIYRSFLEDSGVFHLGEITRSVHINAAVLAAQYKIKTPDALHVATALEQNCEVFLTNDKGIKIPDSMIRVILSEL